MSRGTDMSARKLAVIGGGNWGRHLVRVFCELVGTDRVVCCDQDEATRRQARHLNPGLSTTSDAAEVMEDPEVAAVAIATPPVTHHVLATAALRAQKHVFVEKPLALASEDAEAVCKLAAKNGRVLMVDHLLIYHPGVESLVRLVKTGDLGRVYYVYTQRANLGVVRTEENALWSLGAHDVAIALELMGAEPSQVSATGGSFLQTESGIEDIVFVSMSFPSGELAHLHLSWLDPRKTRRTTVVGSDKMAVFDDVEEEEKLKVYDKSVTMLPENHRIAVRYGDITVPNIPMTEPLKAACQHFLECVERGETPRSDGWSGLRVVRVLEAAQRSLGKSRATGVTTS